MITPLFYSINRCPDNVNLCMFYLNLFFINIIDWAERHMLPCPFKKYLHIECPGCGMQRSTLYLLKGAILSSIKVYPALIPMLFLFIFLLLHLKFQFKNGVFVLKYLQICTVIIIVLFYAFKIITQATSYIQLIILRGNLGDYPAFLFYQSMSG